MYLVLGTEHCTFCESAIKLLDEYKQEVIYYDVKHPENKALRELVVNDLKRTKVPVIFKVIGGYEDLLLEKLKKGL